jgi:hypothetical protein
MQHANYADRCMHSPAVAASAKFECMYMAPGDSGQFEELLPEAHAPSSVENQQLSVGSLSPPSVGAPCGAMVESSRVDLFERDPNLHSLIHSCLSAPPLCPESPDEFQPSDFLCGQYIFFPSSSIDSTSKVQPVSLADTVSHLQHRALRSVPLNQLLPSTSKGVSCLILKIPGQMRSPLGTRCPPFFRRCRRDESTKRCRYRVTSELWKRNHHLPQLLDLQLTRYVSWSRNR